MYCEDHDVYEVMLYNMLSHVGDLSRHLLDIPRKSALLIHN